MNKLILLFAFYLPHLACGQSLNDSSIGSFTDSFFKQHRDYAALAISIVQKNRVVFESGYGNTGTGPVSAQQTVFGAASVSKLFTTVAVLQLVEKGQIRLGEDVNTYLKDFKIINPYTKKVTVLQLLTHSSGIEDGMLGVQYAPGDKSVSLKQFFIRKPPRVVFEPGTQVSYSNRGMAVAGYLVEAISHTPFYAYVEQKIFAPLEMRSSSFRQPLPAQLKKNGLQFYHDEEVKFVSLYPSASLFTTVSDMGKFMMAHLSDGPYNGTSLLSAATINRMHQTAFTPARGMPCMALGFMQAQRNGYPILFHSGSRFTSSLFVLFPEQQIGIYMVLNGNPSLRKDFLQSFISRFLPNRKTNEQKGMAIDLSSFKGTYRANVGARTTVEMLPLLILQATLNIKGKNPTISALGRSPVTLTSLGDSLWLGTDGGTYYFRKLDNGTMQFFRTNAGWADPMTFTRIRWFENGLLHLGIIISGFLLYLFTSLLFGLRLIYFKWKNKHQLPVLKKLGMSVILASVLILASAVVAILYLRSGKGAPGLANYSTLYFIFGFFSCGVLTSLAVPFHTCANLRSKTFPTGWKIYFTLLSIAILLLIPVLWYWNLLGFHF